MGSVCSRRRDSIPGQSRASLLKSEEATFGPRAGHGGVKEDEATWDVTACGTEADEDGEPSQSVANPAGERGSEEDVALADGPADLAERLRIQKEKADREEGKRSSVDDSKVRDNLERDKAKGTTGKVDVKHFGGTGGIDSDLAARLARQKEKEQSGESAIEAPRVRDEEKEKAFGMDSQLAEQLAKRKDKAARGSVVKLDEAPRQKEEGANMDSQLAQRLARQKEKEQTGESAIKSFNVEKQEVTNVDSQLAARLARQKEKEHTGENAVTSFKHDRSEREGGTNVDSQLAARLARQKEKEQTGESAVDESKQKDCDLGIQMNPQLAARLAKQKEKEDEQLVAGS